MGRLRHSVPDIVLFLALAACTGCGGGSATDPPPPPPPPQDFSITLSATSLSIAQGATSSPVNVAVNGQNGFTGTVQVTLSGLPSGIITNPASPFDVTPGAATPLVFGAAASAATGNFSVTAQGASGALSHSANLGLTVQSGVSSFPSRTTYFRTDAIAAMDDSPGEPHRRRIAYDPANKRTFVANRAMNRIEVFSPADQTRVTQISVPGASSADLSADGSTIWVGTLLEGIVAIDTSALQVKARYPLSGISPLPNIMFDRPIEVLALANGNALVRLRQPASAQALLALWNPAANALANLTATAPQLFQKGVGAMARTGDHAKVLAAANDASGEVALFDVNGNVTTGPQTLGAGTISLVAANPDGSHFAIVFSSNGNTQLFLLDASLNIVQVRATTVVHGLAFSRDGKFLYVSENAGSPPVITVLDARDLHSIGQVADLWIQGGRSEIEEGDETQLLFAIANRGVSFIDASNPASLPASVPSFATAPMVQPSEGPSVGGTAAMLAGQNFEPAAQVKFGTQPATSASVISATQVQAASPPSAVNGAVNITAYFPSAWLAIAPDAFSYGPQVVEILPNAGTKSGGDTVQIYGYGFGSDASKVSVKMGGAGATVQKVENAASIASSLGLGAGYPFSLQRITVQTPAGVSGKSDVMVATPVGTVTAAKAFQYLQDVHLYKNTGLNKFVLYDQKRQWVYLSNIDHIDVFDLKAAAFRTALSPPGGPPPNAGLRGLALTPDGARLVAADFGAQNIYLLDPDNGTGSSVPVGGVPDFLNSGPARVAATSTQSVFVGLSGEGGSSGACTTCLGQLNLTASPPVIQPAPQPEVTSLTGAPLVQANAAGDHIFLAFGMALGGPVAFWDAASPNQFTTSPANDATSDLATASDGTMFVTRANDATQIRRADLTLAGLPELAELEQIPGRVPAPGVTLHPSGALVYEPFLTGAPPASPPATGLLGGVDILDAHTGRLRLRIFLPEPLAMLSADTDGLHGGFLAVDENGQRIFALTSSGLTIVQLASVPLGIGTLSPATGPAAGGTILTIRGSGFQNGMTVTIGGKTAAVTYKDRSTLTVMSPALTAGPQQIALTNPDGETAALDAAFTAN